MKRINERRHPHVWRIFALACALVLGYAQAEAQHEGHTSHGQQQPPRPAATPSGPQTKTHDTHPVQQPTPTPEPAKHDAAHDHHHHPPAGTKQDEGKERPAAPATDAGRHDAHGSNPAGQHTHTTHDAQTKRDGDAGHGAHGDTMHAAKGAGGHELMLMEEGLMSVRVGRSRTNFMPMGQMGSGTSWQPVSSPTYMWHHTAGDWLLMTHFETKLGVNRQGGPRGVTKFESQNWLMPMAFRRVGRGTLQLRGMFSLEPLTFSGKGSPQLFQTGEVYRGEPIVDAQHPHDLFMELSAQYTAAIGERATWYAYLGFPGEPALGPVAFMHRPSSSENPTAPLAHHLQDSTHISFGVFTTGFTYRRVKIEGSLFNGREPDDRRYNFEFNPWNSRSIRVTVAPTSNWAMQYSYGFLRNPEFFAEGDTHRQTASVQYNRPLTRGNWATALVWGRNREAHGNETFRLNSYLAESTVIFLDRNYLYTRLELVDREGEDLLTHAEFHDLGFDDHQHPQFRIGAYTFGGARDIWKNDKWSVALGGDATFYSKPSVLDALYGRSPVSYKFFVRIRPARTGHGNGGHH